MVTIVVSQILLMSHVTTHNVSNPVVPGVGTYVTHPVVVSMVVVPMFGPHSNDMLLILSKSDNTGGHNVIVES